MRYRPLAALALALLAGCASRQGGRVERELVLPPGVARYALETHQRFLMAVPIEDPSPAFPAAAPPDAERGAVCAEFVVDAGGAVGEVAIEPHDGCEEATPASVAAYGPAVADALTRWRYFAAAVCTFPATVAPDDECRAAGVRIEPVAVRLRYRFVFEPATGRVRRTGP